ncbi:hypothetical protein RQ734_21655 [Roseomonas mucosa]|uniref:hypothetical protein n=1 Tax=Roseomonas mucosa TaxID=207340 RepID=UPI0028CEEF34|nr:hypothetical protein [Roseomonas mucosa]MDT8278666.1 hypothetical protein [Roseomonas mucosa]
MTDDPGSDSDGADLTAASADEIAQALSYALRFDERGKPRRGGSELTAGIAAEQLTEHLHRAGFVVMKMRALRPHSTD